MSAKEYFDKEYGSNFIKGVVDLKDLKSLYMLIEEYSSNQLPTEEEMYNELNRKLDLGKNHEDGIGMLDTQIGWEQCYDWITELKEGE